MKVIDLEDRVVALLILMIGYYVGVISLSSWDWLPDRS